MSFINAPNFERATDAGANNVYDLLVQASDGVATVEQALRVTVIDVNEAPVSSASAVAALSDLATPGTWVATATAVDPDAGDSLKFALVDDANGSFAIDAATGQITVTAQAVLDVKVAVSYDLLVRMTDRAGLRFEQGLRVNLDPATRATPQLAGPLVFAADAPAFNGFAVAAPSPTAAAPAGSNDAVDELLSSKPGAKAKLARADLASGGEAVNDAAAAGRKGTSNGQADGEVRLSSVNRTRNGDSAGELSDNASSAQNAVLLALMQFDTASPTLSAQLLVAADANAEGAGSGGSNSLGYGLRRGDAVDAQSDSADPTGGASGARQTRLTLEQVFSPAHVASVSFSAGFIWWLTRGGGLLTSMLMGVPAWRHVDLLPVLARNFDDEEADEDENDRKDPPQPLNSPGKSSDARWSAKHAIAPESAVSADINFESMFEVGSSADRNAAHRNTALRNTSQPSVHQTLE